MDERLGPSHPSYRVQERLTRGGQGEIWLASQLNLDRVVALKRPIEANSRSFLREARLSSRLVHPNILPIYDRLAADDDSEDSPGVLVMPYIDGQPWSARLALRPEHLSSLEFANHLREHLQILLQVANAIAYAHTRKIAHLDLKPSQVLLGSFGEVYLIDWGGACDLADPKLVPERPPSPISSFANASFPSGTPHYMAPEQAAQRWDDLGPATDIYLLGAILYEIVAGRAPHEGQDILHTYGMAVENRCHPIPPECPEELATIIERSLNTDPASRFESSLEFRDAVQDYLSGSTRRAESVQITDQLRSDLAAPLDDDGGGQFAVSHYAKQFFAQQDQLLRASWLWGDNPAIHELQERINGLYAERACRSQDFGLAKFLAENLSAEPRRAEALREIGAARARQETIRRQRRRAIAAAIVFVLVAIGFGALVARNVYWNQRQTALLAAEGALADEWESFFDSSDVLANPWEPLPPKLQARLDGYVETTISLSEERNRLSLALATIPPLPAKLGRAKARIRLYLRIHLGALPENFGADPLESVPFAPRPPQFGSPRVDSEGDGLILRGGYLPDGDDSPRIVFARLIVDYARVSMDRQSPPETLALLYPAAMLLGAGSQDLERFPRGWELSAHTFYLIGVCEERAGRPEKARRLFNDSLSMLQAALSSNPDREDLRESIRRAERALSELGGTIQHG